MKVRIGFVSNSSSSSFVIERDCLSDNQVIVIENHIKACMAYTPENKDWGWCNDDGNAWTITVVPTQVAGYTNMDNFDMKHLLKEIGVDKEDIRWG